MDELIKNELNSVIKFLIVGSGPSGVAVANYLIVNGIKPTVVDGGVEASKINFATGRTDRNYKTWFGSAMSYYQPPTLNMRYNASVDTRASFARGGFSRVWGATFAFISDYSKWPTEMIPTQSDIDSIKNILT